MKKIFIIELDVPDSATTTDAKDYLMTAIKSECGCRDTSDPMFRLHRQSIKIKSICSFSKWFDDNRQKLIDVPVQDAAEILYNDFFGV